MSAALVASAEEIAAFQRRLAPVRTGKLRDSISVNKGGRGPAYSQGAKSSPDADPDLTVTITAGNASVRYAHLVEFGAPPHEAGGRFEGAQHPGTKPQPFFYPPYRAYRKRARGRVSRSMRKAIKKSVGQ